MDSFPIKPDGSIHSAHTDATDDVLENRVLYNGAAKKSSSTPTRSLMIAVAGFVALAVGVGMTLKAGNPMRVHLTTEGFVVDKEGKDVSIMSRKPMFPVFTTTDLDQTLRRRQLATDTVEGGGDASDTVSSALDSLVEATLFGDAFKYYPLGTVDEIDVHNFFAHIAATGDGRAECRTELGGFRWSYDVDFPVNGLDVESNVYFGTGFVAESIPYVSLPVLVVDCNKAHAGVCIVGEADNTVLPWSTETGLARRLKNDDADAAIESVTGNHISRIAMKKGNEYSGSELDGSRRMTETFWQTDDIAKCWTEQYNLVGYNLAGHSVLGAIPSHSTSTCPKIVVHAAFGDDKNAELYKTATLLEAVPEEGLFEFGVSMSLRKFYAAVHHARVSYGGEGAQTYDIVSDNCHVFIFDVLAYLQVPYKKDNMKNELIKYGTDSIMKSEESKAKILKSVSEKGVAGKLMRTLRSERAVIKQVVTATVEKHEPVAF